MAGATFDIVVLSSSPPESSTAALRVHGHPPHRVVLPSSSPIAFSPPVSPIRTSSSNSRTNFRAASVPGGDARGFATVGSLMQFEYHVQPQDEQTTVLSQAQAQNEAQESIGEPTVPIKKPRKPRTAKTPAADGAEKPKPKPRQRKPKAQDDLIADSELRLPPCTKSPFFGDVSTEPKNNPSTEVAPKLTKSGKPRKTRARKEKVDVDDASAIPKTRKPRVTKTKVGAKNGKMPREDTAVTSAHFHSATGQDNTANSQSGNIVTGNIQLTTEDDASILDVTQSPQPKKKAAMKQLQQDSIVDNLDLDEAVMRRRDWTPPYDTIVASPFTDSIGKENEHSPQYGEVAFTNLVSNFAYAQSPLVQSTTNAITSNKETTAVTKRRRIELMEIPGHHTTSRNSSPEKGKAPRKKPRTITDIVTEQYATNETTPEPNTGNSNCFDASSSTKRVALDDVAAPNAEASFKKPIRRRNNSQSDIERTRAKAKAKRPPKKSGAKPKVMEEKLLSPTSALSRLDRQDVLFGTSSQLALEESPEIVRQLQHAIKESEKDVDSWPETFARPPLWPKLEKVVGRRGLWAESARDADGGILDHAKDIYMPEPDRTQDIPLLMDGTYDQPDISMAFIDIEEIELHSKSTQSKILPTSLQTAPQTSQHRRVSYESSPKSNDIFEDIDDLQQAPPPSNQNVDSQYSFADIDDFSPPPASRKSAPVPSKLDAPNALSIDTPPKKRRGRPPKSQSILPPVTTTSAPTLHPWGTKPRPATNVLHPPSTPPTATPRFIDIEEILDSEDEALEPFSPTPPRVQSIANLPPLPLATFNGSPIKAKPASPNSALTRIYRIPAAHLGWDNIKADIFARLTNHIRSIPPTHDPKHPSWHEKILMFDPIVLEDFTAYLNANTDICCWRRATQKQIKEWNADAKKRGDVGLVVCPGGDEVLAVEKEMESWMVKAWCEGLSVCCIHRIRGRGGARKGLY